MYSSLIPPGYLLMCYEKSGHYFIIKEDDAENRDPAEVNVTGIEEHEKKAAKYLNIGGNLGFYIKSLFPDSTPEQIDFILFNLTAFPFGTFESVKKQIDDVLNFTKGDLTKIYELAEKYEKEMMDLMRKIKETEIGK